MDLSKHLGKVDLKSSQELVSMLQKELFTVPDTGTTYRTINHWEGMGLLDDHRAPDQRWRRFSFVDYVWIRLLDKMRRVGISIDALKKVKELLLVKTPLIDVWTLMGELGDLGGFVTGELEGEKKEEFQQFFADLFEKGMEDDGQQVSLLQLLIGTVIVKRCQVNFVVFPEGDCFWIEDRPGFILPPEYGWRIDNEEHARIPLFAVVKEFLASDLAGKHLEDLQLYSEKEMYLLELIHSGNYSSIKINFKNQQMHSLELVKSQDTRRKIVDVLAEGKYQDISIVTHNGVVSKIENTIKIKFE